MTGVGRRLVDVAEETVKPLQMQRVVANQRKIGVMISQVRGKIIPGVSLAHGEIGEDKLLLIVGKSRKHTLGFFDRATQVDGAIARFDEFGNSRDRRLCRMNNERKRFHHLCLLWSRRGWDNHHILKRVRQKLARNLRRSTKIVTSSNDMFGNEL